MSAGTDLVDIELTLIDDRLDSDVANPSQTLPIAASALGMKWQYASASPANYRFGGENAGVHGGAVGGSEHYLLQTGTFDYVDGLFSGNTFAYSGAGTGKKAPGWLAVDTGAASVSLMVRDFWQQYPSELSVDGSTLSANLFPARSISGTPDTKVIAPSGTRYRRPNTFYFLHPGGAKTYHLRLGASASTPDSKLLHALNDSYQQHKLLLRATPQWYTASGVWGDLPVGGPGSASAGWDDVLLNSIYIPSFEKTSNFVAQVYGWRDFGDRLREGWADVQNGLKLPSFFDDTHIGSNRFFQQFLRTGEDRWFNLGETATRHRFAQRSQGGMQRSISSPADPQPITRASKSLPGRPLAVGPPAIRPPKERHVVHSHRSSRDRGACRRAAAGVRRARACRGAGA